MAKLDAHEIIKIIAQAKKKTPVKVYIKGDLSQIKFPKNIESYVETKSGVLFGDWLEDMETEWAENRAKLPQDIIRRTVGKVIDFSFCL